MKTNLFSRFRNLFRKSDPIYEDSYEEGYEDYSDVIVEEPVAEDAYAETSPVGDDLEMPPGAVAPGSEMQGRDGNGVHVPLAPIVADLPLELKSRMLYEVGELSAFLPLEDILPQLSKGKVSLPFGELRRAAPRIFGGNRDQDEAPVNVPLSAILPHISPDMLARKHGPLQMDIPEDIVSPFAGKGRGLAIGAERTSAKAPLAPPASTVVSPEPKEGDPAVPVSRPTVRPIARPVARPAAQPTEGAKPGIKPGIRPTTSHPNVYSSTPQRPTIEPQSPLPNKPVSATGVGSIPVRPSPAPEVPRVASSFTDNGTAIVRKSAPLQRPTPASQPSLVPAAQHSSVPASPAPATTRPPLQVSIATVADAWPDAVKQEVIQQNLAQAQLAVPYVMIEAGLKRGRLSFTWKSLRSWLIPPATPGVSPHDDVELELPLRVVAPIFIAQQKEKGRQTSKVPVDKDIPNLFSGLPRPDTTGVAVDHSVTKPLDTNYYVWDDRDDMVSDHGEAATVAAAATAGTEFVTRYATPNEVVSRAAALDGVEGAVIALPDGLMVANQLPPGLNGDTLAAFLPQLFGKVTQCTQELRMGELNNLNFTVGNVPWKIFRVNALYFAAFGVKGEPLPTARLAALAGELDHKAKA